MNRALAIVIAKATLGGGLALGLLAAPHGAAHAAPAGVDVYAYEVGDDSGDGVVMEDESGWDCRTMGNRICGVGNTQDTAPGCYDDTGAMVAPQPCHIGVNRVDGSSDVYYDGDPADLGYPRDCTVTDGLGVRADHSPECDSAWDGAAYVGGYN